MVEHLREIKKKAEDYLVQTRDLAILRRQDIANMNGKEIWDSTNVALRQIDEYMQQLVKSSTDLMEEIVPLYTNIKRGLQSGKIDTTIQILSERFAVPDNITKQYLRDFLIISTNKNRQQTKNTIGLKREPKEENEESGNQRDVEISFDYSIPTSKGIQDTDFEKNKKVLEETGQWSLIDEGLTITNDINKLRDIRKLIELNNEQRETLKQYLEKPEPTSADELQIFDLLFNPKITIRYSPKALAQLYLREICLQNVNNFINWANARGTLLRREANVLEEKLKQEIRRLQNLTKNYEQQTLVDQTGQKQQEQQLLFLENRLSKLRTELQQKQEKVDLLRKGIDYLGDTERITYYYADLEYRVLNNLIDSGEETKTYEKLVLSNNVDTSIHPEQDLEIVRSFDPETKLERVERINNDYQEFRTILFSWWRDMIKGNPTKAREVQSNHTYRKRQKSLPKREVAE